MALVIRSTPFCRPMAHTPKQISTVITMNTIISPGLPSMPLNSPATASALMPVKSPLIVLKKYRIIQPPTVV